MARIKNNHKMNELQRACCEKLKSKRENTACRRKMCRVSSGSQRRGSLFWGGREIWEQEGRGTRGIGDTILCPLHMEQLKKQNQTCLGDGEVAQQWRLLFQMFLGSIPSTQPQSRETWLPLLASTGTATPSAQPVTGKCSFIHIKWKLKGKRKTIVSTL